MSKQEVILCEDLESSLKRAIDNCPHDRLFILTDDHTHRRMTNYSSSQTSIPSVFAFLP